MKKTRSIPKMKEEARRSSSKSLIKQKHGDLGGYVKCLDPKPNGEICGERVLDKKQAKYAHKKSLVHVPEGFWVCRNKGCGKRFGFSSIRTAHEKACTHPRPKSKASKPVKGLPVKGLPAKGLVKGKKTV